MKKVILSLVLIFCFGLIFGQNRAVIGPEQEAAFLHTIGNKTQRTNWAVKKGNYLGVPYVINIEGITSLTSSYKKEVETVINLLKTAEVELNTIASEWVPLEFYFISSIPGPFGQEAYHTVEKYDGLQTNEVMVFTRKSDWSRVNRIVTTVKPTQRDRFRGRLIHGVGRILHEQTVGEKVYWTPQSALNYNANGYHYPRARYAQKVSDYAEVSNKAFVAELFTYAVLGELNRVLPPSDPDYNDVKWYYKHHYRGPYCLAIQ